MQVNLNIKKTESAKRKKIKKTKIKHFCYPYKGGHFALTGRAFCPYREGILPLQGGHFALTGRAFCPYRDAQIKIEIKKWLERILKRNH